MLRFPSMEGWFPSLHTQESQNLPGARNPRLVVLIPAYNEESRIESTLQAYREFLTQSAYISKILVVDDGSTDGTVQMAESVCNCEDSWNCPIQCLSLPKNQGKGAALSAGIRFIVEQCNEEERNSTLILTQDADGSGDLVHLDSLMESMQTLVSVENIRKSSPGEVVDEGPFHDYSKRAIVSGNRNYNLLSPRGITRWGFQTCVRTIMNDLRVQDSQCGYKLMTLNAANDLYDDLEVKGWAHDVEVLYRAKLASIPIEEIPIDWEDKDGSKIAERGVARVSTEMLLDVIKLRWQYSNLREWLSLGDF